MTGSDSGIGEATAIALAEAGCDVGVTWHEDEAGAEATAAAVRAAGRKAAVARLDLLQLPQAAGVVDRLAEELGAYVNFLGDQGQARVREAYPGSTWERLAAIKGRYDPTNPFRLNQNIPPTKADPDDHNDPRAAA